MLNEKNLFLVSDGGSTSRSVSTLLPKTFVCEQFVNTNTNTRNVKMRRIWWRSVCTGRFQQTPLTNSDIPIYNQSFPFSSQWMWTVWRINWEIVKISVSCKFFVLTSTYLLSNILQKLLSTIDIISQNCRTLHLYPLNVNVIQTVTQSVQSVSPRLLIYCELLYRQRRTKNSVSLTFLNICACTSNTFCEHRTL